MYVYIKEVLARWQTEAEKLKNVQFYSIESQFTFDLLLLLCTIIAIGFEIIERQY